MSILDAAFGPADLTAGSEPPVIALGVLFGSTTRLDCDKLRGSLRGYDPEMLLAEVQTLDTPPEDGTFACRITWGKHVIDTVGFDSPAPQPMLERCVQPGHYAQPIKNQAYQHRAHMLLYHGGPDCDPFERHVALAAVAGALEPLGALVAINEEGHTSLPAGILQIRVSQPGAWDFCEAMPIPLASSLALSNTICRTRQMSGCAPTALGSSEYLTLQPWPMGIWQGRRPWISLT